MGRLAIGIRAFENSLGVDVNVLKDSPGPQRIKACKPGAGIVACGIVEVVYLRTNSLGASPVRRWLRVNVATSKKARLDSLEFALLVLPCQPTSHCSVAPQPAGQQQTHCQHSTSHSLIRLPDTPLSRRLKSVADVEKTPAHHVLR